MTAIFSYMDFQYEVPYFHKLPTPSPLPNPILWVAKLNNVKNNKSSFPQIFKYSVIISKHLVEREGFRLSYLVNVIDLAV